MFNINKVDKTHIFGNTVIFLNMNIFSATENPQTLP